MRLVEAELRARELIQARYEGLIVELLGPRASGLTDERIAELIEQGHLDPAAIYNADGRLHRPGGHTGTSAARRLE